jgi:hypothetical protein
MVLASPEVCCGSIYPLAVQFTATTTETWLRTGYFGGSSRQMVVFADDIMLFQKSSINQPASVTASLTPSAVPVVPATQTFSLVGDDPDGAIVLVDWDFGDGQKAQSKAGIRTIGMPGSYTATVRVTDDGGTLVLLQVSWSAGI